MSDKATGNFLNSCMKMGRQNQLGMTKVSNRVDSDPIHVDIGHESVFVLYWKRKDETSNKLITYKMKKKSTKNMIVMLSHE